MTFFRTTWKPTDAEYFGSRMLVGSGSIELFRKNRPAWKAWLEDGQDEQTDAMILGSVVDCKLLEPEKFDERYHEAHEAKAAAARWGFLPARTSTPAPKAILDQADRIVEAVHRNKPAAEIINAPGLAQACHRWTHPSGMPCRLRYDKVWEADRDPPHAVMELKVWTCKPHRIINEIYDRGAHRQQALYRQGFLDLWGVAPPVVLVVASSDASWVDVSTMDERFLEMGRQDVDAALADMRECLETQDFSNPRDKNLGNHEPAFWMERDTEKRHE